MAGDSKNLTAASLTGDTTEKKGARQHERKLVHERVLFLVGRKAKGFLVFLGGLLDKSIPLE